MVLPILQQKSLQIFGSTSLSDLTGGLTSVPAHTQQLLGTKHRCPSSLNHHQRTTSPKDSRKGRTAAFDVLKEKLPGQLFGLRQVNAAV